MSPRLRLLYLVALASIVGLGLFYLKKQQTPAPATPTATEFGTINRQHIIEPPNFLGAEIKLPLSAFKTVEHSLNQPFPIIPKAFRADADAISEAAEYNWFTHLSIDYYQKIHRALELLKLLPPEQAFITQLTNIDTSRVGIYDTYAREILLSQDFELENSEHQKQLIHLLTIANLQLNNPIEKLLDWDTFLSRKALIESRASTLSGQPIILPKSPHTLPRHYFHFFNTLSPELDTSALISDANSHQLLGISKKPQYPPASAQPEGTSIICDSPLGALTLSHFLKTLQVDILPTFLGDKLTITQLPRDTPSSPPKYLTQWQILWSSEQSAIHFYNSAKTFYSKSKITVTLSADKSLVTISVSSEE